MKICKAYKFKLKITPDIEEKLRVQAGISRFAWNRGLACIKKYLELSGKVPSYQRMAEIFKKMKEKTKWKFLKQGHSQVTQQVLKDLNRAVWDAFDPSQANKYFPKFKKKKVLRGFRYPQGVRIGGNRVYLPKIGWVRFFKSRKIEGKLKNTTITYHAGHWYISFQVEVEQDINPVWNIPGINTLGIDMGVANFITLSDGRRFEPLNAYRRHEERLAKEQRKLVRKEKFSNNWKKQKARISRLHRKIADCRHDFLHKVSTRIASENQAVVFVEDLNVKNMTASASGTKEEPGKNVKAKSGLNKSILDQGWYAFRQMLEYKQAWQGKLLIAVPPPGTSITCNVCDHKDKTSRISQAEFKCVKCGHEEHADVNAAKVIKKRGIEFFQTQHSVLITQHFNRTLGHRGMACGSNSRRSRKQEPAGNREAVPLRAAA